jgi:hypothetical protein
MYMANTNTQENLKTHLPMTRPSVLESGPWAGSHGEIDLVDVGVTIWRHRSLMLVVFLTLLSLVALAAIFRRPRYVYTTSIQLGTKLAETGTLVPLMSPETAASLLKNNYIPDAIYQYGVQQHIDLSALYISTVARTDSMTVTMICEAVRQRSADCIAVEKIAAAKFVQDNSRAVATVRAKLQAELDIAKLKLTALKDPTVFDVEKLKAQKSIANARKTLADLQASATVLAVKKTKLQSSAGLYQKESAELQSHITKVRKATLTAAHGSSNPAEAMTNLILSSEEQRSVDRYDTIQHRLSVDLPDELATVNKDIADNNRAQILQKQVIIENQLALKKLLFSHNQQIQSQQITISNYKSQLSNIQNNRVLGVPLRSIKPIGLGSAAILAIGIILAGFLAIFAAMFANYVEMVRARLDLISASNER